MRRRGHLLQLGLATVAASLTVFLPSAAFAYRPASVSQRHAIRRVVKRRWKADAMCPHGDAEPFRFRGASISTADPQFAEASVNDSLCTFTLGYVLRRTSRHGGRWRIAEKLLDSAQPCHSLRAHVPESVIRDFGLKGQLSRYRGGIGIC
jgi:hypothetical protein